MKLKKSVWDYIGWFSMSLIVLGYYLNANQDILRYKITKREIIISSRRDSSLEKLKKEADNTILVCRNCHAEIHAGMHEKHAN